MLGMSHLIPMGLWLFIFKIRSPELSRKKILSPQSEGEKILSSQSALIKILSLEEDNHCVPIHTIMEFFTSYTVKLLAKFYRLSIEFLRAAREYISYTY